VANTNVICVKFLFDVACEKLSKSGNASRSYSKNKNGFFYWTTMYKYSNLLSALCKTLVSGSVKLFRKFEKGPTSDGTK